MENDCYHESPSLHFIKDSTQRSEGRKKEKNVTPEICKKK